MLTPAPYSYVQSGAKLPRKLQHDSPRKRWSRGGRRPGGAAPLAWERRYRHAVAVGDTTSTLLAVSGGVLLLGPIGVVGTWLRAGLTTLVLLSALTTAWNHRDLGQGAEEFQRLGRAVLTAAVLLAFGGLAFGIPPLRGWVFLVVPMAAAISVAQRYLLRKLLHRRRALGRCMLPVIAAGQAETLSDLIDRTRKESHLGWQIRAVCTGGHGSRDRTRAEIDSVPVVGGFDDLVDRVRRDGYRAVMISADAYWTRAKLQRLAWELEDTGAEMVVAPVLMDVAGPRVQVSEVLGMPLLRVSEPVFTGPRLLIKSVVDKLGALLALLAAGPLLLLIACAVRLESGSPVLYRQRRVGRDGDTFTMLKFRTMNNDADTERLRMGDQDEGAGPLFKMRADPRLTRLGPLLRGYSLDELPQLLNVLRGDMSLVGPRPPLPHETAVYEPEVHRRFLVQPGMTGLWQVSGRSDLSWAESVRLDLRYVENWSLTLDAMILWKTFRAVLTKRGAY